MKLITIPDDSYMWGIGNIAAKRVHAPWTTGRALFLASHCSIGAGGYLNSCFWVVYDFGTAVAVGLGDTKGEALRSARNNLEERRAALLPKFKSGRAMLAGFKEKLKSEFAVIEEKKRSWKSGQKITPRRQRVFLQGGGKCHYCSMKLELSGIWQMDHYISLANGGQDHLCNLVAACAPCNQRKRAMNGDDFIALLKRERQISA